MTFLAAVDVRRVACIYLLVMRRLGILDSVEWIKVAVIGAEVSRLLTQPSISRKAAQLIRTQRSPIAWE